MATPEPPTAEHARSARRWRLVAGLLIAAVVVAGGAAWWASSGANRPDTRPAPVAAPPPPLSDPLPAATLTPTPTPKPRPCATQANGPFTPTRVSIPGVTTAAAVTSPPRDSAGVPGTPPLSSSGKQQIAWDSALAPGSAQGNVLLNAHTWPDGSALGNRMLAHLSDGGRIIVQGEGKTLCYRVTQRVEVLASAGYPAYYDTAGSPQLAIVVCSGRRLGPGNWTHRTIWFASPGR